MTIIKHIRWFLGGALALVVISVGLLASFGLPLSIDFAGGTLIEVSYQGEKPQRDAVAEDASGIVGEGVVVRDAGENGYQVRTHALEQGTQDVLVAKLAEGGAVVEKATSVGPSIGAEFLQKSLVALLVLSLMIAIYMALVFRKVSRPVPSFWYGLLVVVILLHDILVPAGAFALFSALFGYEVDALFVVGMLAILGYSVNDTIIVFDRVRENLRANADADREEEFGSVVARGITETYGRSINTSLTVALALIALYLFGSTVTQGFSLLLLVGVVAGTYSSIFIAAPLLVLVERHLVKKGTEV